MLQRIGEQQRQNYFFYFIAYLFFGNEDHVNAPNGEQIIQDPHPNIREDVQAMARIVYLW